MNVVVRILRLIAIEGRCWTETRNVHELSRLTSKFYLMAIRKHFIESRNSRRIRMGLPMLNIRPDTALLSVRGKTA